MIAVFDSTTEQARYLARQPLLLRHTGLRLNLATGVDFQPETLESVEDQIVETLWAEGKTLATIGQAEAAEVRASFSALTPRREEGGISVAATLMLGFNTEEREQALERLRDLPWRLELELKSGARVAPEVDLGAASPNGRLPAVLALRYLIPTGEMPLALVSSQPSHLGRFESTLPWSTWVPDSEPGPTG